MRWAAPLGPRRLRGSNPRSKGTDLRSRLVAPRQLAWPTNPSFQAAASEAAKAPLGPAEAPRGPRPHRRSHRLDAIPCGVYFDSGWRQRASSVSGPCAVCGDDGWYLDEDGAYLCAERVTPEAAEDLPP